MTATTMMGWGLVGLVALSACDDAELHNVGDTPIPGAGRDGAEDAGSSGRGGQAGNTSVVGFAGNGIGGAGGDGNIAGQSVSGTAGFGGFGGFFDGSISGTGGGGRGSFGGSTFFAGGSGAGLSFAGTGGTSAGAPGEGGSSGAFPGCFAPFEVYAAEDQLDLGPQNTVLLDAHIAQDEVRNSANQLVFQPGGIAGGVWETYANFPATTPEIAAKTDILLPEQLTSVPENLGQLYITRRSCAGRLAAGRKLKVEVWWKSSTTFASMPTHGIALGVVGPNDATTWLDDATKTFVVGDAGPSANIDTLNRIALQHTFAADDTVDARKIVLGMWLLEGKVFATNFYIGNVQWE